MNSTKTAPAASTSRLPVPTRPPPAPPHLQPPPRNPKRSSKRLSGNSGNPPTLFNSSSTRSNAKQKPSLSHVINHLRDSPPAHLTSFLSLDSATTPMTAASTRSYSHHHHQHSQVQTPLTAASSNSTYPFPYPNPHARAMSPMTLMELPPLRMEGLTRESVFVDQALSSASSYTVTPIWELSEASGSATMKGQRPGNSNLKSNDSSSGGSASEGATPTTPPTSAGTAAPSTPSPPPDMVLPKPHLDLDLDLEFALGDGDGFLDEWNSSPNQAQTPFNSPSSKANSGSHQPFIPSTLFPTSSKPESDSESNSAVAPSTGTTTTTPSASSSLAFLEEVDRWLAYIEKSLSQLETRHLRLNVA